MSRCMSFACLYACLHACSYARLYACLHTFIRMSIHMCLHRGEAVAAVTKSGLGPSAKVNPCMHARVCMGGCKGGVAANGRRGSRLTGGGDLWGGEVEGGCGGEVEGGCGGEVDG